MHLLTIKPMLYVANVSEDEVADPSDNEYVKQVREYAANENAEVIVICAKIEEEIAELDGEEKAMFLQELGIEESGLDQLIRASYHLTWTCYLFHSRCTGSSCMDIPKRNESTTMCRYYPYRF